MTKAAQRALLGNDVLAPEYAEADISPKFRANGSTDPDDPAYKAMAAEGFVNWRLEVAGLVERPAEYLACRTARHAVRTQITRHDCVEGWSCIGKWTGVPLGHVLEQAGVKPEARFIVFRCADELERTADGSGQYYESIDLHDALPPADHPRLRHERRDPAGPARRPDPCCASNASSATRWPNTSCDRGGRKLRRHRPRQRRLLGRPRLRMVRGNLSVARMERRRRESGAIVSGEGIPDFASLHPGYKSKVPAPRIGDQEIAEHRDARRIPQLLRVDEEAVEARHLVFG